MITFLTRNWWIQSLRGVLALAFGATALVASGSTVAAAALLVAAFAVADGAMTLTSGLALRNRAEGWSQATALGLACIGIGLAVAFWPAITPAVLTALFAAWCVASGALLVVGAARLRAVVDHSWIMTSVGALTIAGGVALGLVGPATVGGFLTFAGVFGVVVGAALLAVSLRLRSDAAALDAVRTDVPATEIREPALQA